MQHEQRCLVLGFTYMTFTLVLCNSAQDVHCTALHTIASFVLLRSCFRLAITV